jgi:hypothetical protein
VYGDAALAPDGNTLATGEWGTVRLWNPRTGEISKVLAGRSNAIRRIVFSPDSRIVASMSDEGAIRVWYVATGEAAGPFKRTDAYEHLLLGVPTPLAFTPDSRHLVAMVPMHDTTIEVWEIASGQRVKQFALQKHPRLRPILLAGERTVMVSTTEWLPPVVLDLVTGLERPCPASLPPVDALALAPDRKTLLTGGKDGLLHLWKADCLHSPTLKKADWTGDALSQMWQDLGGPGPTAYAVHWQFLRDATGTVKFLGRRLQPATEAKGLVAQRIAELSSGQYKVRTQAYQDLEKWGQQVELELRSALASKPTLETKRRLEQLLARLNKSSLPPETLRMLRAIAVLETIGTTPARDVLKKLSAGAPGAQITSEAKRALDRLGR